MCQLTPAPAEVGDPGRHIGLDRQPSYKSSPPACSTGVCCVPLRFVLLTALLSHPQTRLSSMSRPDDDPVPLGLVLNLEAAFRVLEALEDARLALRETGLAPGLQDELATVIRMIHGRLGLEEGGAL